MSNTKIILSWSTGKDAAFALYKLLSDNISKNNIVLLTTLSYEHKRVSMHGVSQKLLDKQIKSIAIKNIKVFFKNSAETKNDYELKMCSALIKLKNKGYYTCCFGDIFLEDLKKYRINELTKLNMNAHFPLWKTNTAVLARNIIRKGYKAIVICVDLQKLDSSFCGKEYNEEFIKSLPAHIDPCGENGEFHTFCYDGPIFKKPVKFKKGKIIIRYYTTKQQKYAFAFQELS